MSRCFTPIQITPKARNWSSNWRTNASQKSDGLPLTVPCGRCLGCRLNRAENWAARMMHEAQLHEHNSFITLTYSDDNLPVNGSLAPDDVTLFFKRLRKKLKGKKVLYYYCGEYGENFSRPHYHIALFNHDFYSDRLPHRESPSGTVYRSPTLESLWPYGYSEIGNLEYDSARYIAGYIQKKVNGKNKDEHYSKLDESTGELTFLQPEFARMSRRPAIGLNWIQQYHSDIYNYDVCEVGNKKLRPPAYYDKWLKENDEQKFTDIKLSREASMLDAPTSNMHELTYTYAAKVIAANKIHRSLEGLPAHNPDGDRLDYYKQRMLENHFWQKKEKIK